LRDLLRERFGFLERAARGIASASASRNQRSSARSRSSPCRALTCRSNAAASLRENLR
jgi:hypothetical protein